MHLPPAPHRAAWWFVRTQDEASERRATRGGAAAAGHGARLAHALRPPTHERNTGDTARHACDVLVLRAGCVSKVPVQSGLRHWEWTRLAGAHACSPVLAGEPCLQDKCGRESAVEVLKTAVRRCHQGGASTRTRSCSEAYSLPSNCLADLVPPTQAKAGAVAHAQRPKVLVTGAAGFIASHVADFCARDLGFDVVGVDGEPCTRTSAAAGRGPG